MGHIGKKKALPPRGRVLYTLESGVSRRTGFGGYVPKLSDMSRFAILKDHDFCLWVLAGDLLPIAQMQILDVAYNKYYITRPVEANPCVLM